jgi:DNA-binding transcriptional ArsR family regulator
MKERQRAVAAPKSAAHSARGRFASGGSEELRRFKAQLFQGLAHPTRIAIVELLRHGELSAGQLIEQLGLEQANASQHLAVLRSKQIVVNRKEGNQVFYSLRDPVLIDVLDILKRYFFSQLSQTMSMLREIEVPPHAAKK